VDAAEAADRDALAWAEAYAPRLLDVGLDLSGDWPPPIADGAASGGDGRDGGVTPPHPPTLVDWRSLWSSLITYTSTTLCQLLNLLPAPQWITNYRGHPDPPLLFNVSSSTRYHAAACSSL